MITATPLPELGVIRLTIDLTDETLVSLIRSDAAGIRPVRMLPDQPMSADMVLTDAEAALSGPILYTATISPTATPAALVRRTTTVQMGATRDWIGVPVLPAHAVAPLLVLRSGTLTYPHEVAVHNVIGRADPLVSLGVQRTARGRLDVLCEDRAHADSLRAACDRGHELLWRDTTGRSFYFLPLAVTPVRATARTRPPRWIVSLDVVEVAPPPGPMLGSVGWTVSTLAAYGLNVAGVATVWPTVTSLTLGPSEL